MTSSDNAEGPGTMLGEDDEIFAAADTPEVEETEGQPAEAASYKPAADVAAEDPPPDQGQEPPAAQAPAPDGQQPPAQEHRIPLRELLDEREARQRYQREVEETRRQLQELQRQQQDAQRQPQNPNLMFEDPEAYTRTLTQTFEQKLFEQNLNFDLRLASVTHGETFQKAYAAVSQDPALARQMISQPSPGEAIVKWWKSQEVLRQVGDDPSAYEQKIREKILAEMNAQQPTSAPQQNTGPRNVTRLPSLNRTTRAAEASDADDGDDSDEAVWRSADGRFARRG